MGFKGKSIFCWIMTSLERTEASLSVAKINIDDILSVNLR